MPNATHPERPRATSQGSGTGSRPRYAKSTTSHASSPAAEPQPSSRPLRPWRIAARSGRAIVRGGPPCPARRRSRQPGDGRSATAAGPSRSARARSSRAPPPSSAGCSRSSPAAAPRPPGPRSGRHQLWGEVRLPGPAGLAARRAGHQPRDVRPGPARHRQIRPGEAPGHRGGRLRHPGTDPRRHQTRLHAADPALRRAGHPDRPRPGPDQPARRRAARHCPAPR